MNKFDQHLIKVSQVGVSFVSPLTDILPRWSLVVFLCSVAVLNEKGAQLQP